MVNEVCATLPLPIKGEGPLQSIPGKGGGPPAPLPGKGTGPGPPPRPPPLFGKGAGPVPPPPGVMKSMSAKNATKLKRSPNMGIRFRRLRGKMEGSLLGEKASQGRKKGSGNNGGANGGQSMADALAEMTKRSTYFQQIEEDVRNHATTIKKIQAALGSFQSKDMEALLKFYQQVEYKLDVLTDESQVLAKFEGFPTKKLESLRMAAALYKKLSGILSELQNWKIESPVMQLLDKIEKYFNKVKVEIESLEQTKDEEDKKLQSHNIHFDFNILVKIKEVMVDISSSCVELALKERRETKEASIDQTVNKTNEKKFISAKMLWRMFQFEFKVYTFAGGQDERAEKLSEELAKEIEDDPLKD